MNFRPGDQVYVEFVTSVFATGAAGNATGDPVGTLNRNGTDDGAVTVTVTNLDTGRYKAAFVIPDTYLLGDVLNLTIAATVSGVAGKAVVWHAILQGPGILRYSKATAGAAATVTLDAAASAVNDFYLGAELFIYGGTGAGQGRRCTGYVGSTKVATVERNWVTNPAAGSLVAIRSNPGPKVDDNLRVELLAAYDLAKTAAQAGDAMALTSGERTTLAGVIWDVLTSALTTVGSIGKLLFDNINATIGSRSSHSAADVWAVGTRTLTSFGTLVSDIWAAVVDSAGVTTLLSRIGAFTGGSGNDVLGFLRALGRKLAGSTPSDMGGTYDNTTDSLEAIRDRGDVAWITGAGGGGGSLGDGDRPVTVLVQDIDDNPVPFAVVSVYTDPIAGNALAGPWPTDNSGELTFMLDDGTYNFVVRTNANFGPVAAQTLVVAGVPDDPAITFTLTPFDAGIPETPGLCRVFGWILKGDGAPRAGASISFIPSGNGVVLSDPLVIARKLKVEAETDEEGYFYADLLYSSAIGNHAVTCLDAGISGAEITVPDSASAELADLLS